MSIFYVNKASYCKAKAWSLKVKAWSLKVKAWGSQSQRQGQDFCSMAKTKA